MNNYRLSKPKAFEASESIKTTEGIEIANLLRSGIKNQTVILVGHNQKWHEIEIESLRIDSDVFLENSHLESAAHYISVNNISLSDMGIIEEVKTDYDLEHEDFLELEKEFPAFDYVQIAKLHDYEKRNRLPTAKFYKKQTLKYLTDQKLSITNYITQCEERKHKIISDSRNNTVNKLIEKVNYSEVVDESKPQHEIKVDQVQVPVQVPVPADSVSLQIFEKLTPEKITELQGLRITQEEIVKSNPVVIITNKTSYAQAKKTAAILLSASTAIDGSKGMEAVISKYLNTIKTTVKTALLPIAKLTREPYDKQKKLIEDWDNRLILQAQNRVKELFAVPFTFNPDQDSYSIGTLIITQKDIEDLSDVDWSKKIEQGKAIQVAMDAFKTEQDAKISALEKRNEELAVMLEKFLAGQNPGTIEQKEPETIISINTTGEMGIYSGGVSVPVSENPFEPETKVLNVTVNPVRNFAIEEQTEEKAYSLPHPDNKLLNELDLAHLSVLEERQYIECREYYAQALQDAADAINDILVNPDKTIQKSVAITELIKTWKL